MNNDDRLHRFYYIDNYTIEIIRVPNPCSYTEYSRYKFSIIFRDKNTGVIIVQIETNEKYIFKFVLSMYQYNMYTYDTMENERAWFDPDVLGNRYIIEVSVVGQDYPTEINISRLSVYSYNQNTGEVIQRLSFKLDEYELDDLLFQFWVSLYGLTYLNELAKTELDCYLNDMGLDLSEIEI